MGVLPNNSGFSEWLRPCWPLCRPREVFYGMRYDWYRFNYVYMVSSCIFLPFRTDPTIAAVARFVQQSFSHSESTRAIHISHVESIIPSRITSYRHCLRLQLQQPSKLPHHRSQHPQLIRAVQPQLLPRLLRRLLKRVVVPRKRNPPKTILARSSGESLAGLW